jgi:flagellar assembly factor FliW
MKFHSRQFGELQYDETHVFRFPEGIIGFEHLREFLVVDDEDAQPFRWLVSVEDSDLSFPLIHPSVVVPEYTISFSSDATIFVVALFAEHVEETTVNLRAPIVIDNKERLGRQVILENDAYALHHPLFPASLQLGSK